MEAKVALMGMAVIYKKEINLESHYSAKVIAIAPKISKMPNERGFQAPISC